MPDRERTLANCSSSASLKEDVSDLARADAVALVEQLRPVSFRWRGSGQEGLGLIAEELASLEPRLVTYGERGEVEGVNYRHLTAVLIAALQHVQLDYVSTLAAQRAEIEALHERLATLEERALGRAWKEQEQGAQTAAGEGRE